MAVTYKEYQCKSMLRMQKQIDCWFWVCGSVSPYKACEHACNYCDGRSTRYHASDDFDNLIHVKINAEEVLKKELDKLYPKQKTLSDFGMVTVGSQKKQKPVIAVSSGISDAYQKAERKYKITRKILALFAEYEVPTFIMTKSDLVLRDLDLIKEINDKVWCNVSFSFSSTDKKITAIFEPRASGIQERLAAMKKIHSEGILTGITYMPILPFISDSKTQLDKTISDAANYGAGYVVAAPMTMREGQAERFYETINKHYPGMKEEYIKLYKSGYVPSNNYLKSIYEYIKTLCRKYNISQHIPRYIPDTEHKNNIRASSTLLLISYYLGLRGEGRKSESFRRLGIQIEAMNEDIKILHKEGRLGEIKGIGKDTLVIIKEFLERGESSYLAELIK